MGFLYVYSMRLTSLDYMRLISWLSYFKQGVILNKTQMQKILFICYGLYYAKFGQLLFDDDHPKAWPYGPVFPRVNMRYNPKNPPIILSEEDKRMFAHEVDALQLVTNVVRKYSRVSAHDLSEWSHRKGSPWFVTVYGKDGEHNQKIEWNKEISLDSINDYFKKWIA